MEDLVDPARGDAPHQLSELLTGAQGPGGQQDENVLLGAVNCAEKAALSCSVDSGMEACARE